MDRCLALTVPASINRPNRHIPTDNLCAIWKLIRDQPSLHKHHLSREDTTKTLRPVVSLYDESYVLVMVYQYYGCFLDPMQVCLISSSSSSSSSGTLSVGGQHCSLHRGSPSVSVIGQNSHVTSVSLLDLIL